MGADLKLHTYLRGVGVKGTIQDTASRERMIGLLYLTALKNAYLDYIASVMNKIGVCINGGMTHTIRRK
jgi:hypothetical protein